MFLFQYMNEFYGLIGHLILQYRNELLYKFLDFYSFKPYKVFLAFNPKCT